MQDKFSHSPVCRMLQCTMNGAIHCGMANEPKPQRNSKSGIRGVSWKEAARKWRAVIQHNNKSHHVGYYDTPLEAAQAIDAKRRELNINQ